MIKEAYGLTLASTVLLCSAALPALADKSGLYILGQLGMINNTHTKVIDIDSEFEEDMEVKTKGNIIGRAALGYQFTDYLGIEAGYAFLGSMKISYDDDELSTYYKKSINTFDLAGKVSLPIQDNFSIYAKAGIAYSAVSNKIHFEDEDEYIKISLNKHFAKPMFSLGTSIQINDKLNLDVSFTHLQGNNHRGFQNQNCVLAGLSYYFI